MNGDGGVGQPDYSLFVSFFGGPPGAAAIDFLTEGAGDLAGKR